MPDLHLAISINFLWLRRASRLVPAPEREEWLRFWQAELWHSEQRKTRRMSGKQAGLGAGIIWDALWLRTAQWDNLLRGTPVLCLTMLCCGCTVAAAFAFTLYGGACVFASQMSLEYGRFLLAAPLVVIATYLTSQRRAVNHDPAGDLLLAIRGPSFLAAKTGLQLIFAYLLSTDLCAPLGLTFPNTAAYVHVLLFVVIYVCGMRWTLRDQEIRCKQCLRLLEEPTQVGRPTHNLLEWNGTAMLCRRGHGALSIPELETSWNQSSEWAACRT